MAHKNHSIRASCLVLLLSSTLDAKAPTLTAISPSGAERGKTVEVTAVGSFDRWPVKPWADDPGIAITPGKDKGKLTIAVSPDAAPGFHQIRLADEEGATSLRPFFVGTLPEVVEAEPNDAVKKPQRIAWTKERPGATINGKLGKSGDVDGFAVDLKKGQSLVASIEANRRMASPMDGVLQVANDRGIVLLQNDDDHDKDPQLTYRAPADGTYLVRVFAFPATPDSTIRFAGGDAYLYRLTLTAGPFVDHTVPLAISRISPGPVTLSGWNIPDADRSVNVFIAPDDPALAYPVISDAYADGRSLRLVNHPSLVEPTGPSNGSARLPEAASGCVTGHIETSKEIDTYLLPMKKGQTAKVRVESRSLGQPLDPVLKVLDPSGKLIRELDDSLGADAEITLNATVDGDHKVQVSDLHGRGGPRFAYLLTAERPGPELQIRVPNERFNIAPGKTLDIAVDLDRLGGYAGKIEVRALGLPAGCTAEPAVSIAGKDSKTADEVTLKIQTGKDPIVGPFKIVALAEGLTPSKRIVPGTITDTPPAPTRGGGRRNRTPAVAPTTEHLWLTVAPEKKAEAKPAEKSKAK